MPSIIKTAIAGAFAAGSLFADAAHAEISREDFKVAGEPGISLSVREVRDTLASAEKPPVILLHGARVPGIPSFDLPVENGSLAADLARAGHRVFIMDARGYGGSSRPGQDGPQQGEPLSRSHEVVRDVAAVVEAVERRTGAPKVALLGWATGGHWVGMYASNHPEKVSHLVIHNALYGAHAGHPTLGPGSSMADPEAPGQFNVARFGSYRLNTAASLLPSWDNSIPIDDKASWRDPEVIRAYQEAALASDPTASDRDPPAFRAPSGAMADSFDLASGRKLWDAGPIRARVLIIRSNRDFWSRPEDVAGLARDLTQAAEVRAVTLPEATHYVHLDRPERGRATFVNEVLDFLAAPVAATD
ncbi:alpha/beta hydrolase [Paramesorhizobium deserti]|uniref:Alpha/beta hydrolase n=1 Tax=Paramesorhizobium deserti TaxID=1494590 RepID=A0A135HS16_9HYPH|nr:alpha/beta fold hydrolase [Paramesorhizobium deserti]KXF75963.1 alpha/beta hydrolase [Paramesorhizobium deserti]